MSPLRNAISVKNFKRKLRYIYGQHNRPSKRSQWSGYVEIQRAEKYCDSFSSKEYINWFEYVKKIFITWHLLVGLIKTTTWNNYWMVEIFQNGYVSWPLRSCDFTSLDFLGLRETSSLELNNEIIHVIVKIDLRFLRYCFTCVNSITSTLITF